MLSTIRQLGVPRKGKLGGKMANNENLESGRQSDSVLELLMKKVEQGFLSDEDSDRLKQLMEKDRVERERIEKGEFLHENPTELATFEYLKELKEKGQLNDYINWLGDNFLRNPRED